jgi:hypothetical protein
MFTLKTGQNGFNNIDIAYVERVHFENGVRFVFENDSANILWWTKGPHDFSGLVRPDIQIHS